MGVTKEDTRSLDYGSYEDRILRWFGASVYGIRSE